MARLERPARLVLPEPTERMERLERPARLAPPAQLLHLTPTKETAAVSILLRVSKPSSISQPAATTRPLVIKRSLASQPAAKTRPLVTKRSLATQPASTTRPMVFL